MQERIGQYCVEYAMGMPCAHVLMLGPKTNKGYKKICTVYMGTWNECIEWARNHTKEE